VQSDGERIALTLNNLGVLHSDQNRMEEARKAYDEALVTYRKLAASNPDTYLPYVARVLWGIGRMSLATHKREEAEAALTEALNIYTNFAERDPAQYGPYLRAVKADLAKVAQ
jgi:tetratricopeptide (TPR) repeat protein